MVVPAGLQRENLPWVGALAVRDEHRVAGLIRMEYEPGTILRPRNVQGALGEKRTGRAAHRWRQTHAVAATDGGEPDFRTIRNETGISDQPRCPRSVGQIDEAAATQLRDPRIHGPIAIRSKSHEAAIARNGRVVLGALKIRDARELGVGQGIRRRARSVRVHPQPGRKRRQRGESSD